MSQKMLSTALTKDDVAEYAIIPGNPDRVERIAQYLDDWKRIGSNREHTAYSGYLDGQKVVVVSTGMGGPSAAITMEELVMLGVHTFIRVGSCASVSSKVNKGDVVIPSAVIRYEGTANAYLPLEFPAVPDYGLLKNLEQASLHLGYEPKIGVSIAKDSLYGEIEPERQPLARKLNEDMEVFKKGGAIASEMEAATLFVVAATLDVRCATVLLSATGDDPETFKDTSLESYPLDLENRGLEVTIEGMRRIIAADKS
ncbi:nucleoside phosphorylase [Vibrio sp. 99-8-1]|uniref:nucleoside phosphorylase n=1 Tax=Vibrio sp. 99-8-1 TaxID=2607602 RepID=UPI0014934CA8|nr:nucleoside phosphorylase [Vibrio sp. 99-8-1]NOI67507.1 nucleoside phosphorylase [Vibrio sp. 99-8-1]